MGVVCRSSHLLFFFIGTGAIEARIVEVEEFLVVLMHGDLLPHQTGITKALHDLTQQNHGVGNNHAKYYMSSVDINHINRMRHRLTTTGLKCQLEDLRGSTEMARSPSRLQEVGVWGHGHGSSALRISAK
jgi:hypothetical protein